MARFIRESTLAAARATASVSSTNWVVRPTKSVSQRSSAATAHVGLVAFSAGLAELQHNELSALLEEEAAAALHTR